MKDFPQDIVDEVNGGSSQPSGADQASATAPGTVAGPQDELVPETKSASADEGAKAPELLTPDQQAVMHRISEAIAMLVYDRESNKPVITMALQGADGMVRAIAIVVGKVAETAKPGVPRELLPMAALAALMILNDFVERIGQKPPELREVLPALIDKLGEQFHATPMEMAQMRRIKAKFGRAEQRSLMSQNMGVEAATDKAEGETESPGDPASEEMMAQEEPPGAGAPGAGGIMARAAEEDR